MIMKMMIIMMTIIENILHRAKNIIVCWWLTEWPRGNDTCSHGLVLLMIFILIF